MSDLSQTAANGRICLNLTVLNITAFKHRKLINAFNFIGNSEVKTFLYYPQDFYFNVNAFSN